MHLLSNLKLKTKLFLLVAMAALGLIVFGVTSYVLRQSSEMIAQVRVYDDVNADAVLPDMNVVEAHVPVTELLMAKDPSALQQLADRIKAAEQAYAVAEKDVASRLPEGRTKELIQGKTH